MNIYVSKGPYIFSGHSLADTRFLVLLFHAWAAGTLTNKDADTARGPPHQPPRDLQPEQDYGQLQEDHEDASPEVEASLFV
jgi:hypothetical protein